MNLKEILNYRQNCLFCQLPLTLSLITHISLNSTAEIFDQGLHIKSPQQKDIYLSFNFDGSLQKGNKEVINTIFFGKSCKECITTPTIKPLDKKTRNLLAKYNTSKPIPISNKVKADITSINTLKSKNCCYVFKLYLKDNSYEVELDSEYIKYYDEDIFYHITTVFNLNQSHINYGSYQGTLKDIFSLKVPIIDTTQMQNTDQLIEKIKMYMMLS